MKKGSIILTQLHSQRATGSIFILLVLGLIFAVFFSEFYTKGEPREAIVAQVMIDTGDYILPTVYASEFAYKPPLMHWLIAGTSLLFGGEVTPIAAKLPSAIAMVIMVIASFGFFNNRARYRTSYLAALILLTSFELHRYGQSARVDMLLTMFIVLTLFELFKWEEKRQLYGIPFTVPLLISAGILTKGPVALVLPMIIFGTYLLLFKQYSISKIIKALLLPSILSLLIPSLWYFEAWRVGGDKFLLLHFGESISRFFHTSVGELWYPLGHNLPFYFPLIFSFLGFLPWSALLFFVPWKRKKLYEQRATGEERQYEMRITKLNGLHKVHLFSLVVIIITQLFYMIPSSKRGVYLLPLYPFMALMLAELLQQMALHARKQLIAYSYTMAFIGLVSTIGLVLIISGAYDRLISSGYHDLSLQISELQIGMQTRFPLSLLLIFGLFTMVVTTIYQGIRKGYTKIAYCVVMIMFFLNLNIDGPIMIGFKEQHSAKRFAKVITPILSERPAEVYAVSRLNERIMNLYGLAYYARLTPKDFEKEQPDKGYMIIWEKNLEEVKRRFLSDYYVDLVASDVKPIQEGGTQLLIWIVRKP